MAEHGSGARPARKLEDNDRNDNSNYNNRIDDNGTHDDENDNSGNREIRNNAQANVCLSMIVSQFVNLDRSRLMAIGLVSTKVSVHG